MRRQQSINWIEDLSRLDIPVADVNSQKVAKETVGVFELGADKLKRLCMSILDLQITSDLVHIYSTTSFPLLYVAVHSSRKRYLEPVNFGRRKRIWTRFYAVFLQYLANT